MIYFPSFIRSLSRCVKYDAKGGKSRSTFCKVSGKMATLCLVRISICSFVICLYLFTDDRFIMKQVKSIEISSFEPFALHYLKHVTKALEEKVRGRNACTWPSVPI